MAIIRKILILICFSVPSLAYGQLADTSYYPEIPEMDENYEIKNKKENSNYPSVDGCFAGKLANEQNHKGSFFNSKDPCTSIDKIGTLPFLAIFSISELSVP
jgi:hypothetical protein